MIKTYMYISRVPIRVVKICNQDSIDYLGWDWQLTDTCLFWSYLQSFIYNWGGGGHTHTPPTGKNPVCTCTCTCNLDMDKKLMHIHSLILFSTNRTEDGCGSVPLDEVVEFEVTVTLNSCDNFPNASVIRSVSVSICIIVYRHVQ